MINAQNHALPIYATYYKQFIISSHKQKLFEFRTLIKTICTINADRRQPSTTIFFFKELEQITLDWIRVHRHALYLFEDTGMSWHGLFVIPSIQIGGALNFYSISSW